MAASSTTLKHLATQGETYLQIADQYLQPMAGTCTIGGIAYRYTSADGYAINIVPVAGGSGLQTSCPAGTAVVTTP